MKNSLKQSRDTKVRALGSLFAAVLVVAGCGGGGSPAPSPAPIGSPAPAPLPVPAPAPAIDTGKSTRSSYEAGSASAASLATYNKALKECGWSEVVSVKELDDAAKAHVNYVALNGDGETHNQTEGKPGFTGKDPSAQAWAAGYLKTQHVGQVAVLGNRTDVTTGIRTAEQAGALNASVLLYAPYHQAGLLDGIGEIGIGFVVESGYVMNLSRRSSTAVGQAQDGVVPFPCASSTNVPTGFGTETPNPGTRPYAVQSVDPYGPGLVIRPSKLGDKLVLQSIVVRDLATGNLLETEKVIDRTVTDKLADVQGAMPLKRLSPLSNYETRYTYTLNGVQRTTIVTGWKTGPL